MQSESHPWRSDGFHTIFETLLLCSWVSSRTSSLICNTKAFFGTSNGFRHWIPIRFLPFDIKLLHQDQSEPSHGPNPSALGEAFCTLESHTQEKSTTRSRLLAMTKHPYQLSSTLPLACFHLISCLLAQSGPSPLMRRQFDWVLGHFGWVLL